MRHAWSEIPGEFRLLEKEGLSVSNVVCWTGRPQRTRRAPRTYWDEHVVTDDWYTSSLVEDVPPEEMDAACIDEDFGADSESSAPPLEDESDEEYRTAAKIRKHLKNHSAKAFRYPA